MLHTKDSIIKMLMDPSPKGSRAIMKAVYAIYKYQTAREVNAENTLEDNGVGFSGAHGEIGTSMGKFFEKRGFLTPKQVAYWRKPMRSGRARITMYAGQLAKIANGVQ